MRPTLSIIFFTVLSGTGYGIWFLLGLGLAAWWPHCSGPRASGGLALCVYPNLTYALLPSFVLVSAGLFASLAHLGQPQRAWRALSQWRSSWLSREGVAALFTYFPVLGIVACGLASWWQTRDLSPSETFEPWVDPMVVLPPLGALLAVGSLMTVFCTANIYASLKPIRAWSNRFVTPGYLLIGLYAGALSLWALATLPGAGLRRETPFLLAGLVVLAVLCATLKRLYWRDIDRAPIPDTAHAIGLAGQGSVRSFEQPHTEENYLTREMGFVLARKHASKLRAITLLCGFVLPALLATLGLFAPATRIAVAWPALVIGLFGIFAERWLFFAEARHAVIGYYGR
jgi:sulfite dehydrogenase (quinone) subunit SoeC